MIVIGAGASGVDLSTLLHEAGAKVLTVAPQITAVGSMPKLTMGLQTSVPGLYFVGPAAANSFGPVMRFAFGAKFIAPWISRGLA